MKLKTCLLLFSFVLGTQAQARNVKEIVTTEGEVVKIRYDDGSWAHVMRKESLDELDLQMTITENSCRPELMKATCHLRIPYIRQSFAAQWKNHPTKNNQPLEFRDALNTTVGTQYFITKDNRQKFAEALSRLGKGVNAGRAEDFAKLECDVEINQIFPDSHRILFYDGTYEDGNRELVSHAGYVRINLVTNRYQDIAIQANGKTASFGIYRKQFSNSSAGLSPFGLAYAVQMFFESKNFESAEDKLCQVKWSVNFSRYFDQVQKLANGEDKKVNLSEYAPLVYKNEYPNDRAASFKDVKYWNSPRID